MELEPGLRERLLAGDVPAQAELYADLASPVFALIRRLVSDRAAAEDVFQESLMAVFQHLPDFRGDAAFGLWVRQIVTSRCFMHLRSPWQRARLALSDLGGDEEGGSARPLASDPAAAYPAQIDLARALGELAPQARAVVWLHDVEGLTHEEIAEGFGRTASFSKSQLARAHQSLQRRLQSTETLPCRTLTAQLKGVS